ncbi:hypothetical protein [Thermosulfidibacter takaii]|nr:hypothetical protein [Thermosulfidibacter takaii]
MTDKPTPKELKFSWDKDLTKEKLIVRRMMSDHPKEVLKDYDKNFLKKIFLKNLHRLDKINRNFWKLILEVKESEFNEAAKRNLRMANRIWDR